MSKRLILKLIVAGIVVGIAVLKFGFLERQPEIILEEDRTTELVDRTIIWDRTSEKESIQAILEIPGLSYKVFLPEESTAYDLMAAAVSQHDNFSFKGREFPGLGFFVEEINSLSQNQKEGMYWIYYINGEPAQVGASQYKVKNKDIIKWSYEKEH